MRDRKTAAAKEATTTPRVMVLRVLAPVPEWGAVVGDYVVLDGSQTRLLRCFETDLRLSLEILERGAVELMDKDQGVHAEAARKRAATDAAAALHLAGNERKAVAAKTKNILRLVR